MKLLSLLMIIVFVNAHEGHDHTPVWKRTPAATGGVLQGKIREGKYLGVTYEFDPRQESVAIQLSEKVAFSEKDYIIKKSHACELEVESSAESLKFRFKTKPIHFYPKSPKQSFKRAPKAIIYQKNDSLMELVIDQEKLQSQKGYPKNIGDLTILSEVAGKTPFTLKKKRSKTIEGGTDFLFLVGDKTFSLGVDKMGVIKFYSLHELRTDPNETAPFDRYSLCFLKR